MDGLNLNASAHVFLLRGADRAPTLSGREAPTRFQHDSNKISCFWNLTTSGGLDGVMTKAVSSCSSLCRRRCARSGVGQGRTGQDTTGSPVLMLLYVNTVLRPSRRVSGCHVISCVMCTASREYPGTEELTPRPMRLTWSSIRSISSSSITTSSSSSSSSSSYCSPSCT